MFFVFCFSEFLTSPNAPHRRLYCKWCSPAYDDAPLNVLNYYTVFRLRFDSNYAICLHDLWRSDIQHNLTDAYANVIWYRLMNDLDAAHAPQPKFQYIYLFAESHTHAPSHCSYSLTDILLAVNSSRRPSSFKTKQKIRFFLFGNSMFVRRSCRRNQLRKEHQPLTREMDRVRLSAVTERHWLNCLLLCERNKCGNVLSHASKSSKQKNSRFNWKAHVPNSFSWAFSIVFIVKVTPQNTPRNVCWIMCAQWSCAKVNFSNSLNFFFGRMAAR